jgi:hypothetical protein
MNREWTQKGENQNREYRWNERPTFAVNACRNRESKQTHRVDLKSQSAVSRKACRNRRGDTLLTQQRGLAIKNDSSAILQSGPVG